MTGTPHDPRAPETARWLRTVLAGDPEHRLTSLWRTGDPRARVLAAVLIAGPALLGTLVAALWLGWVVTLVVAALTIVLPYMAWAHRDPEPHHVAWRRLRTPGAFIPLAISVVCLGFGPSLWDYLPDRGREIPAWHFAVVMAGMLLFFGTFERVLSVRTPADVGASETVRQGVTRDLTGIVALLVQFLLCLGPRLGLTAGLVGISALVLVESPWPRYAVTVRLGARTGALPQRPARFLDWARREGLVRPSDTDTAPG
ncbi:hypothetical protein [Actinokineospora enzanensis]|uniref:hypothetical protein n=1 Tax=Actinokineospora enzanensis TaxID=155975 RepID=UPI0003781420|nr:hypothetical protein [Actinokineospora enzanensis]